MRFETVDAAADKQCSICITSLAYEGGIRATVHVAQCTARPLHPKYARFITHMLTTCADASISWAFLWSVWCAECPCAPCLGRPLTFTGLSWLFMSSALPHQIKPTCWNTRREGGALVLPSLWSPQEEELAALGWQLPGPGVQVGWAGSGMGWDGMGCVPGARLERPAKS